MADEHFDAAVIGGGPAGSMAALALARRGWRTVLIERGPRGRGKACGDCLSAGACRVLDRHGLLSAVRGIAAGSTRDLRIHMEGRTPLRTALAGNRRPGGLLVERSRFDQLLVDAAAASGVEVIQPATARLLATGSGRETIEVIQKRRPRRIGCGLVVGADGLRSGVARAAGLVTARPQGSRYGFAMDLCPTRSSDLGPCTIEMFVGLQGYLGIVSHGPGRVHVAGLVRRDGGPTSPHDFMAGLSSRFPLLAEAGLRADGGAPCPTVLGAGPIPFRPARVAGKRVALVGDAAGYPEPFTGQGMCWALESAEALDQALAGLEPGTWTEAAAGRYRLLWRRRVGRRQRLCRILAAALDRPRMTAAAFSLAGQSPRVARWLARRAVQS